MCVFLSVSWELWNVINFNPPKNGGFSSIFFRSVKPPQFGGTWMCGSVDVDSDAWTQGLGCPHFRVPPRKLTSNLKITTLERKIIFKPYIFRFHVSFRGVLGGGFAWMCFMSPVEDYSRFLPTCDVSSLKLFASFPLEIGRNPKRNVIFQPFKRPAVIFRGVS